MDSMPAPRRRQGGDLGHASGRLGSFAATLRACGTHSKQRHSPLAARRSSCYTCLDERSRRHNDHVVHRAAPVLRRRGGRPAVGVARADDHRNRRGPVRRAERRLQPDSRGPRVRPLDAVPPADRARPARLLGRQRPGRGLPADADVRVFADPGMALPRPGLLRRHDPRSRRSRAKRAARRGRRGEITWGRRILNQENKVVQEGVVVTLVEGRGGRRGPAAADKADEERPA